MKKRLTVFVVDDDPAVRESLVWLIESAGLTARAHATAQEFLDTCDRDVAGCVVVDVHMPKVSGYMLARALADRNVHLPIVFISGQPETCPAASHQPDGSVYLEKPFSDEALLDCVRRAIEADLGWRAQDTHEVAPSGF